MPGHSHLDSGAQESSTGQQTSVVESRDLVTAVQRLYQSDPVVRMILDHAAGRLRNQVATRVDRLLTILRQRGHHILRDDLLSAFGALANVAVGKIVHGRTPLDTRFVWHTGLMDLGRRVVGPKVRQRAEQNRAEQSEDGLLNHVFHLRADLPVSLRLPLDLSLVEVTRLSAFLHTLPLERHDGA